MKKSLPAVTLRQGHEQAAEKRVILHIVPVFAHYPHNFYVVGRPVLWRLRETNVLSNSVSIRENFLGQFFVDDCHAPPIFVFALGLIEIAAAQ